MKQVLNKIYLLTWKNVLLRKRHLFLSICEIAVPITLYLLIAYARSKINTLSKQYVNYPTYTEPISTTDFYYNKFPVSDCKLLYTPNTDFTTDLMRRVQLKLSLSNSALLGFNTESDLLAFYELSAENYTVRAVVFKILQVKGIPKFLNYEIRPHDKDLIWETQQLFEETNPYVPGLGSEKYIDKGFIALQLAIDSSYIEMMSNTDLPKIYMQEFPYPPHLSDMGVNDMFTYILPIVTVFSFIILCSSILKRVVEEKSSGIKELMKMMGLKSWMHWLGWFIHAFFPVLISVFIIVILMKVTFWDAPYPPLEYCSGWVLFTFLLLYCIASIAFCFAFSTFFSNPTIAMISGISVWVLSYFIFKSILNHYPLMKWYKKVLMSLFPNIALEFGFNAIAVYEAREIGIQWNDIFKSGSEGNEDITMFNVLMMFIIDTFVYLLFTLYFDEVNPGPYGLSKPYYYPLLKLKKLKKFARFFDKETKVNCSTQPIIDNIPDNVEPAEFLKTGIRIRNLRKTFGGNVAVCGLSMDIYKDQITALLGHNGAGKTTTLNILTGMIKATSGEIIINDVPVVSNSKESGIDKIRSSLGLCPQHNLQFKDLTVFEHLKFFGMLRNDNAKQVEEEVRELLKKLNLSSKSNDLSSTLSGGMKRKLSLGIALIGNSNVLILDEPTSGLDPEARREIWDMLLTFRGSRTIVITTHFMEEADVLGDRIAIMDHGRLECYGTPMFLKRIYGTGYHLKILLNDEDTTSYEKIRDIVNKHIPEAEFKQQMGSSCTVLLPTENKSNYGKLLEDLEENKEALNITNLNLTHTTLEEVFLRVEDIAAKNKDIKASEGSNEYLKTAIQNQSKKEGHKLVFQQFIMLLKKKLWIHAKLKKVILLQVLLPLFLTLLTVYFSGKNSDHYIDKEPELSLDLSIYGKSFVFHNYPKSEFFKNISYYYNQTARTQNGIPVQVPEVSNAIINKGIQNIVSYKKHLIVAAEFNDSEDQTLVNAMYSSTAIHGAPISLNILMNAILKAIMGEDYSIALKNAPLESVTTTQTISQQNGTEVGILWLFLFPLGLIFGVSGCLSFPQIENNSNSKQLQIMCGIAPWIYWITCYLFDLLFYFLLALLHLICIWICLNINNPNPFIGLNESGAFLAIFFVFGVSGIPYAYFYSYKRSAAGAFAAFIITSLFVGITLTVIVTVMEMSGDPYYENVGKILRLVFPVFPPFGLAYTSLHFSLRAVSNHNWMIKPLDQKNAQCYFKINTNPCCYGDHSSQCIKHQSYFYSEVDGISNELLIMAASTIVYLLILIFIETNLLKVCYDRLSLLYYETVFRKKEQLLKKEDEVESEHQRICSTLEKSSLKRRSKEIKNDEDKSDGKVPEEEEVSDVLLVNDLEKVYGGKKVVKGISFGVDKRSCFGLLGVNGAGKTTTFRMLTGSEPCTGGRAGIFDGIFYNINNREYLQRVGYCPQFDAINELLPGRRILELFAALRGLSDEDSKKEVEYWITALGLEEYANQPCGEYSGGNKRKLSMAIALIGNQLVTMLDEPTSGVDPMSRRKLWDVLTNIRSDKSSHPVVLTSHSMEECEMLCNKLAIMKDGQLQCIGTIPRLKEKFGQGYTVYFKLKPILSIITQKDDDQVELLPQSDDKNDSDLKKDERVESLKNDFEKAFSCSLKDEHSGLLHYHINQKFIRWSDLFKKIEEFKEKHSIIEDYNISETTLEEVFLSIARTN